MSLPTTAERILREANAPAPAPVAEIVDPPATTFELAGGYYSYDDQWVKEFEVRELTGADEEALGKINKAGQFMIELLNRGLVQVGDVPGKEVLDDLLAGDWETILLAIRSVTFGDTVDYSPLCNSCGSRYEITINLADDIRRVTVDDPNDVVFTFTGRHDNVYEVSLPMGSTQRTLLHSTEMTPVEQNSFMLTQCLRKVDRTPNLGRETVLQMPMADRRTLLREIAVRKPGPRLEEVTTLCPSCGAENAFPLSIAALFR